MDKSNRGFKHEMTARLLCPVTKLSLFDEDPDRYVSEVSLGFNAHNVQSSFCRRILSPAAEDGIRITSCDWPLMLYDKQQIEAGRVKPGLLRSPYLVRVSHHRACDTFKLTH